MMNHSELMHYLEKKCTKNGEHDPDKCISFHRGVLTCSDAELATAYLRRNPCRPVPSDPSGKMLELVYLQDPCKHSYSEKGHVAAPCPNGNACGFSHNLRETMYHPLRYMTQECNRGKDCDRTFCSFFHNKTEKKAAEALIARIAPAGASDDKSHSDTRENKTAAPGPSNATTSKDPRPPPRCAHSVDTRADANPPPSASASTAANLFLSPPSESRAKTCTRVALGLEQLCAQACGELLRGDASAAWSAQNSIVLETRMEQHLAQLKSAFEQWKAARDQADPLRCVRLQSGADSMPSKTELEAIRVYAELARADASGGKLTGCVFDTEKVLAAMFDKLVAQCSAAPTTFCGAAGPDNRRDVCALVRRILEHVLNTMLVLLCNTMPPYGWQIEHKLAELQRCVPAQAMRPFHELKDMCNAGVYVHIVNSGISAHDMQRMLVALVDVVRYSSCIMQDSSHAHAILSLVPDPGAVVVPPLTEAPRDGASAPGTTSGACKSWKRSGSCRRGDACRFAHV